MIEIHLQYDDYTLPWHYRLCMQATESNRDLQPPRFYTCSTLRTFSKSRISKVTNLNQLAVSFIDTALIVSGPVRHLCSWVIGWVRIRVVPRTCMPTWYRKIPVGSFHSQSKQVSTNAGSTCTQRDINQYLRLVRYLGIILECRLYWPDRSHNLRSRTRDSTQGSN